MTYNDLFQKVRSMLCHYTQSCEFEASQLFQFVFGAKKIQFNQTEKVDRQKQEQILLLTQKRLEGYPLQYLLGEWEFYGLTLKVGEGVLIPRADTETIVDTVLEAARFIKPKNIADLCSGSGAIALALWDKLKTPKIYAVELSDKALPYLKENVHYICQGNNPVNIIHGDVLGNVELPMLDIVVSNPPYIAKRELEALSPEVKHEPVMALDGGDDGLYFYKNIARMYYEKLNVGGVIVFEAGYNQADDIIKILRLSGYHDINYRMDLNKIKRAVFGIK